jgi:hypothetical protein
LLTTAGDRFTALSRIAAATGRHFAACTCIADVRRAALLHQTIPVAVLAAARRHEQEATRHTEHTGQASMHGSSPINNQ